MASQQACEDMREEMEVRRKITTTYTVHITREDLIEAFKLHKDADIDVVVLGGSYPLEGSREIVATYVETRDE